MRMLMLTVILGIVFVLLVVAKSPLALLICFAPAVLPFIGRYEQNKKQQELIDAVKAKR